MHLLLNAYWQPIDFDLPSPGNGRAARWRRWIDTALPSPDDIVPWDEAQEVPDPVYRAEARSVVVFHAPSS
jgi:glycogen operon protein